MSGWHRVLTPFGWLAIAGVLLVLLVAFAGFDPLGLRARKMEQLRRQAQVGELTQKARRLEAVENARLGAEQAKETLRRVQLAQDTGIIMGEAANDPSGQSVLDADRLGRLQRHDRLVCESAARASC